MFWVSEVKGQTLEITTFLFTLLFNFAKRHGPGVPAHPVLCARGNSLTSGEAESSGAGTIVYTTRGLSVKPDGGRHLLHHHCAKGIYDLRLFTTNHTYPFVVMLR